MLRTRRTPIGAGVRRDFDPPPPKSIECEFSALFSGANLTSWSDINVDRGNQMPPPNRLSEALKTLGSVCDLLENSTISPSTLFYLVQLREVLQNEVEELERKAAA